MNGTQYRRCLREASTAFHKSLFENCGGTTLKIQKKPLFAETDTDGWSYSVARLGKGGPWLEIWLDYYTGHDEPTFWYGFFHHELPALRPIIRSTPKELKITRKLRNSDVQDDIGRLVTPLKRQEFKKAVEEHYHGWDAYYFGVYEKTLNFQPESMQRLGMRAASFAEDIVASLSNAGNQDCKNVYPRMENRKKVQSHLRRERSAALSEARKQWDNYCCTVCGLTAKHFAGHGAATLESHHIVPLASLKSAVLTRLEDLITVCANCHRMLHRMTSSPSDIRKLKSIMSRHRS